MSRGGKPPFFRIKSLKSVLSPAILPKHQAHCSRRSALEWVRSWIKNGQAPFSTTTDVLSVDAMLVSAHAASNCSSAESFLPRNPTRMVRTPEASTSSTGGLLSTDKMRLKPRVLSISIETSLELSPAFKAGISATVYFFFAWTSSDLSVETKLLMFILRRFASPSSLFAFLNEIEVSPLLLLLSPALIPFLKSFFLASQTDAMEIISVYRGNLLTKTQIQMIYKIHCFLLFQIFVLKMIENVV
mmetsp:Transcript_3379/g.4756  ORF Transcript_3379/g.4756 Transcript_3379/m.4756 type:complete len:244 (+) Transcript_3379:934-1665(+)